MSKFRFLLFVAALAFLVPAVAEAGPITITGSGTWDSSAPTIGDLSAPNATWSFSFTVPDPLPNTITSVTNGQYLLNGNPVSETIAQVIFYPTSNAGLFDIVFSSGDVGSLYGAQIYNSNTLALIPGNYSAGIDIDGSGGPPNGVGSGTVNVPGVAAPEPSSLLAGCIGALTLGGFVWLRRTREQFTALNHA